MTLLEPDLVVRMVAQLLLERMATAVAWYDCLAFGRYTPLKPGYDYDTGVRRFKAKRLGADYDVRLRPDDVGRADLAQLILAEALACHWDVGAALRCGAAGAVVLPVAATSALNVGPALLRDECMARFGALDDLRWFDAMCDVAGVRPDAGDPLWGALAPGLHGPAMDPWQRMGRLDKAVGRMPAWLNAVDGVTAFDGAFPSPVPAALDADAFERAWDAGVAGLASLVSLSGDADDDPARKGGPVDRSPITDGDVRGRAAWLASMARYRDVLRDAAGHDSFPRRFPAADWRSEPAVDGATYDGDAMRPAKAVAVAFRDMLVHAAAGTDLPAGSPNALALARERVAEADGLTLERVTVTMALAHTRLAGVDNGVGDDLSLRFPVYVGLMRDASY